jgi:hypothetical protein
VATIKTGLIDTEDILSNERVIDMSEKMSKLQPDEQQFRVMLSQIGAKEAVREIVEWLEDEYMPRVSALSASATSAATNIDVTGGEGNTLFRVGHVVRVQETGEGLLVTATAASAITVTRSWGGTAAASATSVAKLLIVGNASAQGASSGASHVVQRVRQFNYVQDQRDPFWFSDIESAIELYGGREPGKETAKKAVEHGRAIENSLFWGARDFNASASPGPMGSCGGALEFISTNISNTGGATTPAEMDTFFESAFAYGSKSKVLFCAPRVGTVLSQMYRDKWQPTTAGNGVAYGAKVDAFINSTYGMSIPVVVKREWVDLDATGTNYGTYGFLLDMSNVRLRKLRDFPLSRLRRNIQEPSSTAVVHEYQSLFSLEFAQEKSHSILKGVTSYSAS